jgi:sugar lactone lactonase YvrE
MQGKLRRNQAATCVWLVLGLAVVLAIATVGFASVNSSFVLFESGQVRPLALSPDGSRLFAVDTPDNRLVIFSVGAGGLTKTGEVEVGMEPVAVAARTNTEVWVVNNLSDSVSIVDVSGTPRVVRTLLVGDEPHDIVFAGPGGNRAFITTARRGQNVPATVPPLLTSPGTKRALVWVFDATDLDQGGSPTLGGVPLTIVQLFGDTPRALAVSPNGNTVYAAVFQSGNQTATVTEGAVCNDGNLGNNTPAGSCTVNGVSMPGGLPNPEKSSDNANRPETGLIVRYNGTNWVDGICAAGTRKGFECQVNADCPSSTCTIRNWDNAILFTLPDLDVFKIDATANPPTQLGADANQYADVGTVLFNMVANPVSGKVYVSNTDANNKVRFEGPGVVGKSTVRGHLHEARITVLDGTSVIPRHLNKHIDYGTVPTTDPDTKAASLATPVGLAVSSDGATLYVTGFGSQKIGVYDTAALEGNTFHPPDPPPAVGVTYVSLAGGGPSGLALDETNDRLYVLTRFDNSVRVVDTVTLTENTALKQSLYNPEPASVVDGRPFLYDAAFTSSNGETSCSSCHVFGDLDSLAWDLGNPDGTVVSNFNPFRLQLQSTHTFHPMKGPMTTQSLRGLFNAGPMHWRGDRTGAMSSGDPNALNETLAFEAFNVAFNGLLGRSGPLTNAEMAAFTTFMLQSTYPPNPIRSLDNSLTTDESAGQSFYVNTTVDTLKCNDCHVVNPAQNFFGTAGQSSFEGEPQELKVPHLRNAYSKVGMFGMPQVQAGFPGTGNMGPQVRGFGFLHDGSVDTVFDFLHAIVFNFGNDTQRQQVEAFVFAMDSDLAPIVGQQVTLTNANNAISSVTSRLDLLDQRTNQGECEVIVKGQVGGLQRGWVRHAGGLFRSDRASEPLLTAAQLRAKTGMAGQDLTFTAVPVGSGDRMGIDRDEDGYFDRDELDAGSNPADPLSIPQVPTPTITPPLGTATTTRTLTPTATASSTRTATATATSTGTATRTSTATSSRTSINTATPTRTPTITSTATRTASVTSTSTASATATLTATGMATATVTATPLVTDTATATATATETSTPTMSATATETETTAPTVIPATLVAAKKIKIKNALPDDESSNRIMVLTRSTVGIPAPASVDDPRCNADPPGTVKVTLTVASPSGQSHTADLPCQNWQAFGSASNPKGYKYRDPELADGTARIVVWKHDLLKATLLGSGSALLDYDLQTGVSQNPVAVKLAGSSSAICMQCNGSNGKDGSDGKLFLGKDCPPPVACAP